MRFLIAAVLSGGSLAAMNGLLSTAYAAPPTSTPTGNDVSYPQCGKTLSTGQAFGIVGVNGGKASIPNSCFQTQLAWANASTGQTSQPKASVYVNTGNPGDVSTVTTWPNSNQYATDANGVPLIAPDPYGPCTPDANGRGLDNQSCAWQYGWNMAFQDVTKWCACAAAAPTNWWLDVETGNSWELDTTRGQANDRADLEGMVAYLQGQTLTVGIYSTSYQWGQIAGTLDPTTDSSLMGLPDWIPGARTLKAAQSNCSLKPFTPNSKVILTQWTGTIDNDYACPPTA